MACFIAQLMTILVLNRMAFMIIRQMFHGRLLLSLMLLLLLGNFVSGFRLELMYISLIQNALIINPHIFIFICINLFLKLSFAFCSEDVSFSFSSLCDKKSLAPTHLPCAIQNLISFQWYNTCCTKTRYKIFGLQARK